MSYKTVESALRILEESMGNDWMIVACHDCNGLGRRESPQIPETGIECLSCHGRGYLLQQVAGKIGHDDE